MIDRWAGTVSSNSAVRRLRAWDGVNRGDAGGNNFGIVASAHSYGTRHGTGLDVPDQKTVPVQKPRQWWSPWRPRVCSGLAPAAGPLRRRQADRGPANRAAATWWRRGISSGSLCRSSYEGSRWDQDKDLSFVPMPPECVVEVSYEHMEGIRFHHTAQFLRWRPDRELRSCTYEHLDEPVKYDLADILAP